MPPSPQQQLALSLFAYAAQRGTAPARLEQLAGVSPTALLNEPAGPLSAKQWHDLWLNAAHLTDDPLFGLHFGEAATPMALGVVSQLVQSSRTVGEALTQAVPLLPLFTDQIGLAITHSGQRFSLRFHFLPGASSAVPEALGHLMEFFLAFVLHELDGLVLERIRPDAVWFPPAARRLPDHARALRAAAIADGQPGEYVLEIDNCYWDLSILTGSYEMQALLLKKVAALTAEKPAAAQLKDRISGHLLANAYLGLPSLEALAANFCLSPRSLQRKLQDEGTTYQEVADAVRKTLALHYLQAGHHPLKEVSYLLGYNEVSAFSRAFKRWTGQNPGNYRAA
ncbi:AraC family transcriptional regulator [Hymenobacter ruricola]|uniref:AraC family transcriptional regulator ligand-binding domain-containing protein n=1 Tax=Hymenobacter ruricola TaxID=2791023 RepID=A0ABS0I5F4_9BACT|nr:AraC family transcriptional regulator [Hymenobacter ruricola]MBF9221938.1 AraC family transcriptional regulator ligand-binding domain-containing protein [Hymenobacter ruricola]